MNQDVPSVVSVNYIVIIARNGTQLGLAPIVTSIIAAIVTAVTSVLRVSCLHASVYTCTHIHASIITYVIVAMVTARVIQHRRWWKWRIIVTIPTCVTSITIVVAVIVSYIVDSRVVLVSWLWFVSWPTVVLPSRRRRWVSRRTKIIILAWGINCTKTKTSKKLNCNQPPVATPRTYRPLLYFLVT